MRRTFVRSVRHRDVVRFGLVIALVSLGGPAGVASAADPGTQVWAKFYDGPGNGTDAAVAVVAAPSGTSVFVAGSSIGATSRSDYAIIAYDPDTGTRRWMARYDGPTSGKDQATALAVSRDSKRVFVTGGSAKSFATVAYRFGSPATQLWVARYDGPGPRIDTARSVAVSPDGTKVFVTGNSDGASYDFATIAYDAVTGERLWVRRYDGPAGSDDGGVALTAGRGRVFVTGSSNKVGSAADFLTIAYEASTGKQLWIARYNGPGSFYDIPHALVLNPAGTRLFVTGWVWGSLENAEDYATVAYDAVTGERLWAVRYDGPGGGSDIARSIAIVPDGTKVFVTGESLGTASDEDHDYATFAYDASTGAVLWKERYDGPANAQDGGSSVAVGPDGAKVFVTGSSAGTESATDVFTVAYDAATGAVLWDERHDGPSSFYDGGASVAVHPAGTHVYVTGFVWRSLENEEDFATIAYAP